MPTYNWRNWLRKPFAAMRQPEGMVDRLMLIVGYVQATYAMLAGELYNKLDTTDYRIHCETGTSRIFWINRKVSLDEASIYCSNVSEIEYYNSIIFANKSQPYYLPSFCHCSLLSVNQQQHTKVIFSIQLKLTPFELHRLHAACLRSRNAAAFEQTEKDCNVIYD